MYALRCRPPLACRRALDTTQPRRRVVTSEHRLSPNPYDLALYGTRRSHTVLYLDHASPWSEGPDESKRTAYGRYRTGALVM
eukprot:973414-Prymnesium_polylepis.2